MATKKTTKKEAVKETAKKAATEKVVKEEVKKAAKAPAAEKKVEKKATKSAAKTVKKVEKALIPSAVKGLFFEYGDKQVDASELAELAKTAFKENGGKGTIRSIDLYVKAEDNALYYVINGKESGKVEL